MKNCTLLVLSCDKYSDAWIPFFTLLKRYWGGSIENLKIVLMAESKQFSFDGLNIKTFPTDKKEFWSERLLRYLDLIDTDFVMLACEDSFLRKKNDPDRIQKFISYMENNPDISNINVSSVNYASAEIRPTYDENGDLTKYIYTIDLKYYKNGGAMITLKITYTVNIIDLPESE